MPETTLTPADVIARLEDIALIAADTAGRHGWGHDRPARMEVFGRLEELIAELKEVAGGEATGTVPESPLESPADPPADTETPPKPVAAFDQPPKRR